MAVLSSLVCVFNDFNLINSNCDIKMRQIHHLESKCVWHDQVHAIDVVTFPQFLLWHLFPINIGIV